MGLDKRNNEKIAVKIYEKKRVDEPNKIKNLEREINILAELSHPTIAKLIDVIETQTELYLILEYGGANSLYNYLLSKPEHRLPEAEAKQFLLVIAEALKYLHDLDIVHRDIKAENILINRNRQLKLIDFGFSLRCKRNGTIDTFCGTPTYMAPEIVSKVDHSPIYTDMWSLGILFYVMLQGNYPFRAKSETDLFEKIKRGSFEYIHGDTSKESRKLIESLLKVNHLERLTIHDVLAKTKWLAGQE
jgi:serine/threonine protein kinase